jgi:hypothetical protein
MASSPSKVDEMKLGEINLTDRGPPTPKKRKTLDTTGLAHLHADREPAVHRVNGLATTWDIACSYFW